jgi:hypothetical protein
MHYKNSYRELMKSEIKKKISTIARIILVMAITVSCVESLTDSTTSGTPTITVTSPKTNDTVKVGKTVIYYSAADASSGTGLSFYELYINKTFTKKYTQNTDGTNPTIYLVVDSAYLHTRISYSLKVYNASGKSKESTTQTNIYVIDKAPSAPSNLLLTRISDYSVMLKWDTTGLRNAQSLELWRKDTGNGTIVQFRKWKTLPMQISYTDIGLSPYVDYTYKLRAYGEGGYSDFSNEISTSSLPGGPWSLQAEAIGSSSVRLTWVDFATNEQGFQIERTNPTTSEFEVLALTGPNVTEYYDNSVSASTAYSYRVAYFTLTTQSSYSNTATVSTYYTDVEAPTITYYDDTGVIQWHDNSNYLSKSTIIEKKVNSSGTYVVFKTISSDNTTTDYASTLDVPTSGTVYYYRLRQSLGTKTYTPYTSEIHIPK